MSNEMQKLHHLTCDMCAGTQYNYNTNDMHRIK